MKPLCEICLTRHESYQAHVLASNKVASNALMHLTQERVEQIRSWVLLELATELKQDHFWRPLGLRLEARVRNNGGLGTPTTPTSAST